MEGEMINCTNPVCNEKIYAIYPEDNICQKCGANVHYDGKEIPEYEILTPPRTDGE